MAAIHDFVKKTKCRVWRTGLELGMFATMAIGPWFDPVVRGVFGGATIACLWFLPQFIKARREALRLQADYDELLEEEAKLLRAVAGPWLEGN